MTEASTAQIEIAPKPHHIRITSDGTSHNTDVLIDGVSARNHITAIDWHLDVRNIATARITFVGVEIDGIAEGVATIGDHRADDAADPRVDDLTDEISGLRAQLDALHQLILQASPQCATCATEHRQGTRPAMNLVNVIIDGTGYCHEHVDLVSGRLVPKKTSGLIITGG